MLWIHLVFAITTPILWVTTLVLAWRRFPIHRSRANIATAQEAGLVVDARSRADLADGFGVLLHGVCPIAVVTQMAGIRLQT